MNKEKKFGKKIEQLSIKKRVIERKKNKGIIAKEVSIKGMKRE